MSEGDTVHDDVAFVVHEFQFYVFLVSSYNFACSVVIDIACAEVRLWILGSEGLESLQVIVELAVYVVEVQHVVNLQYGICLLGQYVVVHILFEAALEFLYVLRLQGQARRIGVSAEVLQYVAATLYGLVDVETCHRTCRTCGHISIACKYHGWAEVYFRQPGGNDADDSLVPLLVVDDDGLAVRLVHQRGDNLVGLFGHCLVQVLALLVVMVYLRCLVHGLHGVAAHEQFHGFAPVLYAS